MNGDPIILRSRIKHNDRIILGTATTFLVKIPGHLELIDIDWEYCWLELSEHVEYRRLAEVNN